MNCTLLDEQFPFTQAIYRTPGVHLSDVITDMARVLFKSGQKVDAPDFLQFEKGFLWERVLSVAFGEGIAERIGEVERDGIACSPDGLTVGGEGRLVVEEYKATTMSSNKGPADVWRWKMQAAGYCAAVGATVVVFRVFNICGDHRDFTPKYNVWLLEFTEREVEDIWQSILAHALDRGMV